MTTPNRTDGKGSGKLRWDGEAEEVQLIQKPIPQTSNASPGTAQKVHYSYRLYLTSKAERQIRDHIEYGERTSHNQNEQGGLLLGKTYEDSELNIIYAEALEAIPGENAKGNPVYLEMNHEVWRDMLIKAEEVIEERDEELQIVGWYHTHPNELDVFMSGTDRQTQQSWFAKDWHFAVVINPHRKLWKVFQGAEAKECNLFSLDNSQRSTSRSQPNTSQKTGTRPSPRGQSAQKGHKNPKRTTYSSRSSLLLPLRYSWLITLLNSILLIGVILLILFGDIATPKAKANRSASSLVDSIASDKNTPANEARNKISKPLPQELQLLRLLTKVDSTRERKIKWIIDKDSSLGSVMISYITPDDSTSDDLERRQDATIISEDGHTENGSIQAANGSAFDETLSNSKEANANVSEKKEPVHTNNNENVESSVNTTSANSSASESTTTSAESKTEDRKESKSDGTEEESVNGEKTILESDSTDLDTMTQNSTKKQKKASKKGK